MDIPKKFSKMRKMLISCHFGRFQIQNIHKTDLKRRLINISSKFIQKQRGISQYMVTPRGEKPKFWPKITTNVGINAYNFQIWKILQCKLTMTDILDEVWSLWWYFFKSNYHTVVCKPIWCHARGVKPPNYFQKWPQILVNCK